jgi:GNAT superfamily N-acetyltransferase
MAISGDCCGQFNQPHEERRSANLAVHQRRECFAGRNGTGEMTAESRDITLRLMTPGDIPEAQRIRHKAGWNQTDADWQRFLDLSPGGCFAACEAERVLGTVTALPYEKRFGWIGMLLVDSESRGRGIGTQLLNRSIHWLTSQGIETLKLDATPMGHPLYLQLGFVDEYAIERWERAGRADSIRLPEISSVSNPEVERICEWDREVFGADRSSLLVDLYRWGPAYAAVSRSGAEITGYMLGRAGTRAHYLGPWVAVPGSGAAGQLFGEVLERLGGAPVFVDICDGNGEALQSVRRAGFQPQRSLTRMFRGSNRFPGRHAWVCGIAGPELG